jgi:hypothetical protein
MARRNLKTDAPEITPPVIPNLAPPPPPAAGKALDVLKIDELRLLKITRLMEKERAAKYESMAALNALNGLFQEFLNKDPKGKELNEKVAELQAEAQKASKEYAELVASVGKELNLNMQEYAFDDETGVLHKLPAVPPPAPRST